MLTATTMAPDQAASLSNGSPSAKDSSARPPATTATAAGPAARTRVFENLTELNMDSNVSSSATLATCVAVPAT